MIDRFVRGGYRGYNETGLLQIRTSIANAYVPKWTTELTDYELIKTAQQAKDEARKQAARTCVLQRSLPRLVSWVRNIEMPISEDLSDMMMEACEDLLRSLDHTPIDDIKPPRDPKTGEALPASKITISYYLNGKSKRIIGWVQKHLVRRCKPFTITVKSQERIQPITGYLRATQQMLGCSDVNDSVIDITAKLTWMYYNVTLPEHRRQKSINARLKTQGLEGRKYVSINPPTRSESQLNAMVNRLGLTSKDLEDTRIMVNDTLEIVGKHHMARMDDPDAREIVGNDPRRSEEDEGQANALFTTVLEHIREHNHWRVLSEQEMRAIWLALGIDGPAMHTDDIKDYMRVTATTVRQYLREGFAKLREAARQEALNEKRLLY